MSSFWRRHWFLAGLMLVLGAGLWWPQQLRWLADARLLRNAIVFTVLLITTLPLETRAIVRSIGRPLAPLLGTAMNFLVLPLLAWGLSRGLQGEWATGLIVAAAAPCTMASAAVWTRRAGGNDVVALMVTVLTNLLCFCVTPAWIAWAGGVAGVQIDFLPMVRKLALLVLLPMVLGQLLRLQPVVARVGSRHKLSLATLAQTGILMMVLMGAIHCGLRLLETEWAGGAFWVQFLRMLAAVVLLHVSVLFFGQRLGRAVGLERAEWIAVGFAGSQKTLMIGLQVALMLGGGLTVLPMVAYHVAQLMIDTLVADRLRRQGELI